MNDRKKRDVRGATNIHLSNKTNRSKQLNSIRKQQKLEHEKNINIFDFLFSFGVLC